MYHFTANHPPEPVRLSFRALIPGHVRQYLKDFQLDAIRFMHNFFAKGEFCVYNDESGLGKQAAVTVLLDAACSSRKCLIVVQNDDRYVSGWEFHFGVLTNANITVIKDEKDSTDSHHSIYIAKWSTLRAIDDLTKFKFDLIILDNRGQMLNNSFCTSMLLKHYESKINILISSVDITSDLKLLHNVLRLGGRLDPQFSSFKIFEEKYKLPDAKELAYKRVDLEEYFCKRERLSDYCKGFRLRRYCHQFETQLPLVKEDRYKINLELWREKQNATNSESSSIEYINRSNCQEEQIKDTQELFEEYCRQRRKQHLQFQREEELRLQQREREILKGSEPEKEVIYNVDDEVALINETPSMIKEKTFVSRENSDEPILMSPLLVESDSDLDDIPEMYNPMADIDIVDLSSEEKEVEHDEHDKDENTFNVSSKPAEKSSNTSPGKEIKAKKKFKKRSELDKLEEDIADTLKLKKVAKRLSRHEKDEDKLINTERSSNKNATTNSEKRLTKGKCSREKLPKTLKNTNNVNLRIKIQSKSPEKSTSSKNYLEKTCKDKRKETLNVPEIIMKKNYKTSNNKKGLSNNQTNTPPLSLKSTQNLISVEKENMLNGNTKAFEAANETTSLKSRKSRSMHSVENISTESPAKIDGSQVVIKQEILEETPKAKKLIFKDLPGETNSEKLRSKRELEISPAGIHLKQTRSMQRLTRSARGSKYLTKNLSLQIDKVSKSKKKPLKDTPKSASSNKSKKSYKVDNKQTDQNKQLMEDKTKSNVKSNTQNSIISHRSSQDLESLQCAQRLSDAGVFENCVEKATEFLVPSTPNAITKNSLLPSSLISSTGLLSESEVFFISQSNPNITNRKRDQVILLSSSDNENSTSQTSSTNVSMTSRRTRALKPKRNTQQAVTESNRVSSFSDMLAQPNKRVSAKSPDLFSNCSDLVQPNLDNSEPNTPFEGFKIFGSEVKQMQQHYAFNKIIHTNKQNANLKNSYREQRSCLDILEKMFEPSNKKSKQLTYDKSPTPSKKTNRNVSAANKHTTNTQILPSHPLEVITETCQQHEMQKSKRSIAATSSGLQDDDIFEITNNGTFGSVMRLHSNGEISPVQNTQKSNSKQHNKITNYLIGNAMQNGSHEETTTNNGNGTGNLNVEAGTPSKRYQQLSAVQPTNLKKSPKSKCNTTQATKLTKWFTKPLELSSHETTAKAKSSNSQKTQKTPTKQVQSNHEVDLTIATVPSPQHAAGKRILKRRRLDLSFNK